VTGAGFRPRPGIEIPSQRPLSSDLYIGQAKAHPSLLHLDSLTAQAARRSTPPQGSGAGEHNSAYPDVMPARVELPTSQAS
jgi:hypothetical protein